VEAPAEFPPFQDIPLRCKYAAVRQVWRKHFSEWGVSWGDDVQAVMVELLTRAKDITPSYIIHFTSSKSMCDAPATRDGVQEWFSRLLNAAVQGSPAAVAQHLCRVRTAHVLTVITAAYAKYVFRLPKSVNARPTALSGGRQPANNKIMPAPEDRPCLPSSSPARRGGNKRAAPAEVEDDDVARCRSPQRKSVAKVEDVGASDSKGRHDRTMVRMMTAVGMMLNYYNPDTEKWPSVHEVFVRMPPDILEGMSEPSIGLMRSCGRWARRGNKGREERTYDRLHTLALTKPGVTTATDALQYVRELHEVMTSHPYWKYKHVKRTTGSVAIPRQKWLAEAETWVPTLDADRAGNRRPPPPGHECDAELCALGSEEGHPARPAAGSTAQT